MYYFDCMYYAICMFVYILYQGFSGKIKNWNWNHAPQHDKGNFDFVINVAKNKYVLSHEIGAVGIFRRATSVRKLIKQVSILSKICSAAKIFRKGIRKY